MFGNLDDYKESPLDLNTFLIKHRCATYFMRMDGNSMYGAGIFNGDILVVDRSLKPVPGDVAVIISGDQFGARRLIRKGDFFSAVTEQGEKSQEEGLSDFELFGVVTSVIRKFRK